MKHQRTNWESVRSSLVGLVVGALLMTAFPAVAAGVGDAFRLGQVNSIDAQTTLRGDAATNLRVTNTGTGSALALVTAAGVPPLTVSTPAQVARLNADLVDGKHAAAFAAAGHAHSGTYLPVAGKAADSNLLDGRDSTAFIRTAFSTNVQTVALPGQNAASITAEISAPTSGYLIAGASVDADLGSLGSGQMGTSFLTCLVEVDGTAVPGSLRGVELEKVEVDTEPVNTEADCSTNAALVVGAGDHTVTFDLVDSSGIVGYGEGTLWVLWTPFGSTGTPAP